MQCENWVSFHIPVTKENYRQTWKNVTIYLLLDMHECYQTRNENWWNMANISEMRKIILMQKDISLFVKGTGYFNFLNIFSRSALNDPWTSFLIDIIIAYLFPINEISNYSTACSPTFSCLNGGLWTVNEALILHTILMIKYPWWIGLKKLVVTFGMYLYGLKY